MKIFILKKSIADLKKPVVRVEYETDATTIRDFICEMTTKNYGKKRVKDTLAECCTVAQEEFVDGGYYIINKTRDFKYLSLDDKCEFADGDEVVLIKLKYVRGIVW